MDFGSLAQDWWDPAGPMRPLHAIGPSRISYIRQALGGEVAGKSVLDIGCGAGLVSEALARLDARVTGVDRAPELIQTAQAHAAGQNLTIDYRTVDAAAVEGQFDAVLLLEVVEHLDNPLAMIETAASKVKPGGVLILSTLNRTVKSFALGKVAAEYILRWVPQGTHDWDMFLKPSELVELCEKAGLKAVDLCGLTYDPFKDEFALDKSNLKVNYFLTCRKD